MNFKKLPALLVTIALISACTTSTRSVNSNRSDASDDLSDLLGTNTYGNADPTLDLFDTDNADDVAAPTTTTTTVPVADATATSCMANNDSWLTNSSSTSAQSQWACLNAQASQGNIGQETVSGLATASIGMMANCSLAVREEIIYRLAQINGADAAAVKQIFKLAKVKMTQCYYNIVNTQSQSMPWAPYQAQVYNYNSGNIWNLLSGFNQ